MRTYPFWLHFRDQDGATVDILPLYTVSPTLSAAPLYAAATYIQGNELAEWCDVYPNTKPGNPRPLLAVVWAPAYPHGTQNIDVHITKEGYDYGKTTIRPAL